MTYAVYAAIGLMLGLAVPDLIRRLPEPATVVLPDDPANDTDLERQLRQEGAKVPYAALGSGPEVRVIAAVLGGLFGAAAGVYGTGWFAAVVLLAAMPMTLLFIVDTRTRLLPVVVVWPTALVIALAALMDWFITRDSDTLVREGACTATAYAIFALLHLFRGAGMGRGDVRLAAPLGLLTAAVSWNAWLVGLYAAFLGFAVFGVGLMLIKRDRRVLRRAYPFGPFMIAGAYAGMALAPHVRLLG